MTSLGALPDLCGADTYPSLAALRQALCQISPEKPRAPQDVWLYGRDPVEAVVEAIRCGACGRDFSTLVERAARGPQQLDLTDPRLIATAATHGTGEHVTTLVRAGCDARARVSDAKTPLQLALAQKNESAVLTLLQHDDGITVYEARGDFPLVEAATEGRVGIVARLSPAMHAAQVSTPRLAHAVDAAAAAAAANGRPRTLLQIYRDFAVRVPGLQARCVGLCALFPGAMHAVKKIIRGAGPDGALDLRDLRVANIPVTFMAARSGNAAMLVMLLRAGSSLDVRDNNELTAADYARHAGHAELAMAMTLSAGNGRPDLLLGGDGDGDIAATKRLWMADQGGAALKDFFASQ